MTATTIGKRFIGSVAGRRGVRVDRKKTDLRCRVEGLEPRLVMATFLVSTLDDAGPGSLRDAIDQANRIREPNEISFAPDLDGPIVLTERLPTIRGELKIAADPGERMAIVRDSSPDTDPFRLLMIADTADVNLVRLDLSGGHDRLGGGIYNEGKIRLESVSLTGNSADAKGGGLFNAGVAQVVLSTISGNSAEGVSTIGFGPAGIGRGGAIFNTNGISISASTISDNFANRQGGAIYNESWVTLNSSTVTGNVAEGFVHSPLPVPIGQGGAIYSTIGVKVNHSTIVENVANRDAGAIFSNVTRPRTPPSTVVSSIVTNNEIGDIVVRNGEFESEGYNLFGSTERVTAGPNDLTGPDPLLAPLGNYGGQTETRPALPGSPAINAGLFDPNHPVGQRGFRREAGKTDIGATQGRSFSFGVESGGNQSAAVGQAFAEPLVVKLYQLDRLPPEGAQVTFRVPDEGPSATINANPATINADGIAQVVAVANGIPGTYTVIAEAVGADNLGSFTLTNVGPDPSTTLGRPLAAMSAQRPVASAARGAVEDLRAALPKPSRVASTLRERGEALARQFREQAREVPPALARFLDQQINR